MNNKLLVLLFALITSSLSYGQNDFSKTSHNNAYLEVLGNGGLYSLNYERIVIENVALRLGIAAFKAKTLFGEGTNSVITVPVMGNFLFGKKKGKFELGGGFLLGRKKFTPALRSDSTSSAAIINLIGVIGYRRQPATKGFMYRVGLTPFYPLKGGDNPYPSNDFLLSIGVSIGYSF